MPGWCAGVQNVCSMKDFVSNIQFKVPGSLLWEIRNNFETERTIALQDDRHIALESEEWSTDSQGHQIVERVVAEQISVESVPKAIRGALPVGALVTRTRSRWYPHMFDESHPSTFATCIDALGDKVCITGRQWVAQDSPQGCTMCTNTKISVNVPFVGCRIEGMVCERMETSCKSYAHRIEEHAKHAAPQPDCSLAERGLARRDVSTSTSDLPSMEMQRPQPPYIFAFPLLSMFTNVFVDSMGARRITPVDSEMQAPGSAAPGECKCTASVSRACRTLCRALRRRVSLCGRSTSSSTRDTEIAMQLVEQSQMAQVSRQCAALGIVD